MNIQTMISEYADMMAELQPLLDSIAPLQKRADDLAAKIKQHVLAHGSHVEGSGYKFEYRRGSEKSVISVDADALVDYAVAHPEVERFITRSVKTTAPTVALKKLTS